MSHGRPLSVTSHPAGVVTWRSEKPGTEDRSGTVKLQVAGVAPKYSRVARMTVTDSGSGSYAMITTWRSYWSCAARSTCHRVVLVFWMANTGACAGGPMSMTWSTGVV